MSEDELKAALAAKEEEVNNLKTALTASEQTKVNSVDEIKELRAKKQEAEAERDIAKAEHDKLKVNSNPGDVEGTVRKVLDEKDSERIIREKGEALEAFKNAHKELFSSDNDPGGLKLQAFETKLSRLNLSSAKSHGDFIEMFEDALTMMNRAVPNKDIQNNPYANIPMNQHGKPQSADTSTLSPKEKKLIEQFNTTEEKYLKLKKSKPTYVATLLESVRD